MTPDRPSRVRTKALRPWRVVLIVIISLIAIRVALPYILLKVVNDRLASIPGYHGHIEDLDLALIRGAYQIQAFELDKLDSTTHAQTRFLSADNIDLSVEWKALFHGSVVGELVITAPEIRFTKDAVEPAGLKRTLPVWAMSRTT